MNSSDSSAPSSEEPTAEEMTAEEKRHDQLTTAPNAVESDADPRIDVTVEDSGVKRIDWRDDAPVRPGKRDDEE
jgi:hypothetical protein